MYVGRLGGREGWWVGGRDRQTARNRVREGGRKREVPAQPPTACMEIIVYLLHMEIIVYLLHMEIIIYIIVSIYAFKREVPAQPPAAIAVPALTHTSLSD